MPAADFIANGSRANRCARPICRGGNARFLSRPRSGARCSPCCCGWQPGGRLLITPGGTVERHRRCQRRARRRRPPGQAPRSKSARRSRSSFRTVQRRASSSPQGARACPPGRLERRSSTHAPRACRFCSPAPEFVPSHFANPDARLHREDQLRGVIAATIRRRRAESGAGKPRCPAGCGCAPAWDALGAASSGQVRDTRTSLDRLAIPSILRRVFAARRAAVVSAYVQFAVQPARHHLGPGNASIRRRRRRATSRPRTHWVRAGRWWHRQVINLGSGGHVRLTGARSFTARSALDQLLLARPFWAGRASNADPLNPLFCVAWGASWKRSRMAEPGCFAVGRSSRPRRTVQVLPFWVILPKATIHRRR